MLSLAAIAVSSLLSDPPESHYSSLFLSAANRFFSYAINFLGHNFPLSQNFLFWKSPSILAGNLTSVFFFFFTTVESNARYSNLLVMGVRCSRLDNHPTLVTQKYANSPHTAKLRGPWSHGSLQQTALATLTKSIRRFFLPETRTFHTCPNQ